MISVTLPKRFARRDETDCGVDAVVASRQQPQALRGFVDQLGRSLVEYGFVAVENHGVDPDIEVENPPHELVAGHDPQLERAIRRRGEHSDTAADPDDLAREDLEVVAIDIGGSEDDL